MKKLSIILACALVALISCTKSKEVHPEIGDGNDEIVTVGMKDVHVEYVRTDHAELNRVVFHYSLAQVQQFEAAEMTKQEIFFELTLNDLLSDTLYDYYYELFYNGGESPKTEQKTFHTQAFVAPEPPEPPTPPTPPAPDVPEGAINGLFTINENGDQVYFSKGNLQYQASTNTWRFAEHQWDYVGTQIPDLYGNLGGTISGSDNKDISSTYNGWIDLFGWGTSGYYDNSDVYNTNHYPYCTSFTEAEKGTDAYHYNRFGYGPSTNMPSPDLTGSSANYDWGVYNAIINGGNVAGLWRTFTREEWDYVFNLRSTSSGIRYAKAQVDGINGVVLLPDDWNYNYYELNSANTDNANYDSNIINLSTWYYSFEVNGAVFLPAAGERAVNEVRFVGSYHCCPVKTDQKFFEIIEN